MNAKLILHPETIALILIDLQVGIVSTPTTPHSVTEVLNNSNKLIKDFHKNNATVVFVKVSYSSDGKNKLKMEVDEPAFRSGDRPKDWSDISSSLERYENDLLITKHQWGAFYNTGLDLELRRRGINTIVLGGIATNYGVESTARDAYERGYQLVFASDAMASRDAGDHEFAINRVFPRLGKVGNTDEIIG